MPIKVTRNGKHTLQKPDGTQVSQHTDIKEAYEKASSLAAGKYKLIVADETIDVTQSAAGIGPTAVLTITSNTDATVVASTAGTLPGSMSLTGWTLKWGDGKYDSGTGVPPATVTHTYTAAATITIEFEVFDLQGKMARFLTSAITVTPPTPLPVPEPPVDPPTLDRQLLGGWRLAEEYARGVIAIDFSRMKLWMVGDRRESIIAEYDLPAMGTGTDINNWPIVEPVRRFSVFLTPESGQIVGAGQEQIYCNGLAFFQGKLWATPKVYYDTASLGYLRLHAEDGEIITLDLQRQMFSGFVKRGPSLDPYLGCGGYESGQGSCSGPTVATLSGQRLLEYGWPGLPGPNDANGVPVHWNERAPRDTNYFISADDWVAWNPRVINGELQGRWASDRVYGGGLVLPEGIFFWPNMGTGELIYATQSATFAPYELNRNYEYRYNASTFEFVSYTARPDLGASPIGGQELGPDGKVYLAHTDQWNNGHTYTTEVALKVYG